MSLILLTAGEFLSQRTQKDELKDWVLVWGITWNPSSNKSSDVNYALDPEDILNTIATYWTDFATLRGASALSRSRFHLSDQGKPTANEKGWGACLRIAKLHKDEAAYKLNQCGGRELSSYMSLSDEIDAGGCGDL